MKHIMKRLMIITAVLLGAAFIGTNASAVVLGTAPAGGTIFFNPVPQSPVSSFGLAPGSVGGLPPGLVRQSIFNPFLNRPVLNPFLIRPIFNPFLDDDFGLGLGLNPGFEAD